MTTWLTILIVCARHAIIAGEILPAHKRFPWEIAGTGTTVSDL